MKMNSCSNIVLTLAILFLSLALLPILATPTLLFQVHFIIMYTFTGHRLILDHSFNVTCYQLYVLCFSSKIITLILSFWTTGLLKTVSLRAIMYVWIRLSTSESIQNNKNCCIHFELCKYMYVAHEVGLIFCLIAKFDDSSF